MDNAIKFIVNWEKAIETIVFLANKRPNIDIYHLAKVLFYAEKKHVNRYARPIIGDNYICMSYGPVPSGIRDLITHNSWINPEIIKRLSDAVEIAENQHRNVTAQRQPILDYFSETDIECLEEAFSEYGGKTFSELAELTHQEACWIGTGTNQPIDYSLMVDEDNPDRLEVIEEMRQNAAYVRI